MLLNFSFFRFLINVQLCQFLIYVHFFQVLIIDGIEETTISSDPAGLHRAHSILLSNVF